MPLKKVSQKTLVACDAALREHGDANMFELLYDNDFPDWFARRAKYRDFDWQEIIPILRNGRFFFFDNSYFTLPGANITDDPYLSQEDAVERGEVLLSRLTALAATLHEGDAVRRSLELEGLRVDQQKLILAPAGAVVNEQQEEDQLVALVKQSQLPNGAAILKHMADAHDLFVQAKDHPSIGESRNFIQALIDDIGATTNANGGHSVGYPAGMASRLEYLKGVGFFTHDEKTAFGAAWGFLSAGAHPGIPTRDEARIGLILSLEFGQLLLLKFLNWAANRFRRFS